MEHLAVTTKGFEAIGPRSNIEINLRKSPLNNIKVRKAIAHCLDRDFTIENISMGFAKPAIAPLRYTNLFCNPNLQRYEFNLSKANQLLDEAGYKRGVDGIRFTLSIDFIPGGGPTVQASCEFLREQLKKVGINLSLRPPPDWATWVTRVSNWDFELNWTAIGDQLDPAIGMDRSFTSKNIKNIAFTNTMGYSNLEVDRLCDEARKELNFEKRKKLYHRLQEILWDELPIIWNTDVEWTTLYNKDFVGLPMDKFGLLNPLDTVYWRKGKVGP
jgi:peptide/nickel transport system substrate-binding protein